MVATLTLVMRAQRMLELEATSVELQKQRRLMLKEGDKVRIGRQPINGCAIPWDLLISREHVELIVKRGKVTVQKLAGARNEVHFRGATSQHFTMELGEKFRIGSTTFHVHQVGEQAVNVGTTVGRFRLAKLIGEGVLGPLYGAIDGPSKLQVAVKLVHAELLPTHSAKQHFQTAMLSLIDRQATGCAQLHEIEHSGDQFFYAREFVQGTPLSTVLVTHGKVSPPKSREIVEFVARHLKELHGRKLFHGNLKPSNIITRMGTVRLVDPSFGGDIGRIVSQSAARPEILNAANYLPPESVIDLGDIDIRSDIYALGCVWFELLTGAAPFSTGTVAMRLAGHAKSAPPRQRLDESGADAATCGLILRMLAKLPTQRFQTPDELIEALTDRELTGQRVSCGGCGKVYRLKGDMSGKKVNCTACGVRINIPYHL